MRLIRRNMKANAMIDGCFVECSTSGTLVVYRNDRVISVLVLGTNAALDELGPKTKAKIVKWWKEVR